MSQFKPITQDQLDKPEVNMGPQIIPGTEKMKSPFTEGQTKDAGFAYRMEQALRRIEELEGSGFDPANFKDLIVDYLGGDTGAGIRGWLERIMLSPKYKQYERAKYDFSTAQLRKETGAVINDSEIVWINQTYFPQVGDDEATLKIKEQNRRDAIAAMKSEAGAAYTKILENNPTDNAKKILEQRAESDPALRQMLIEQGVISE